MAVKMITTNKAVRLNFEILESVECGIALRGAEVKGWYVDALARQNLKRLWLDPVPAGEAARSGL